MFVVAVGRDEEDEDVNEREDVNENDDTVLVEEINGNLRPADIISSDTPQFGFAGCLRYGD